MELKRFYTSSISKKGIISLDGEEFYHAVKVTRHKVGYLIIINIGDGKDYISEITEINKDYLLAKVREIKENDSEPTCRVTLFQGISKEFDLITQKAVELGVFDIQPFISSRTNKKSLNMARLNKIILESAKQCGRAALPIIHLPIDFDDALRKSKEYTNKLLCYENASGEFIKGNIIKGENLALYIGSEGGFTEEEVDKAIEEDIKIVSLGKRILRAETASISALTLAMSELGEL